MLRRTAIIALALSLALAACVQEPRYARSAAGNQPDQHAPPAQQEAARPPSRKAGLPYDVIHPKTVICFFPATPHTKAHEQRGPIPPGKKIEDLCPPGAHVALFYDPVPHRSHAPLPLGPDIRPTTFVCEPQPRQQPRPIPPGKPLKDLCPPGTSALLFYDPVPSAGPHETPDTRKKSP